MMLGLPDKPGQLYPGSGSMRGIGGAIPGRRCAGQTVHTADDDVTSARPLVIGIHRSEALSRAATPLGRYRRSVPMFWHDVDRQLTGS